MIRLFQPLLALLSCVALLWGCATQRIDPQMQSLLDKPGWVSGNSRQYPEPLFFTGHGVSAQLARAKRQAMDDVAQRFRSQVKAFFDNHSADNTAKSSFSPKPIPNDERILSNRQLADIWQDPVSNAYHVLAVIDRVRVGSDIRDDIYRLDNVIDRTMKKAAQQADALQRVAYADVAVNKVNQIEQLQTLLKIVQPAEALESLRWPPGKITNRVYEWLSQVKLMPVLQNNDPEMKQAFLGGVKNAGFIVDDGAKPDYILKASFQQKHIKWNDGVYTLDGSLRLELRDSDWKGQVRGAMNWPIRISATERALLHGELAKAIRKANEQKLKATLIELQSEE
ncbi:MAG: hypothetical protein PVJ39_15785 [Gammaproteobacteria bacterium]|jgi:hypothetical protein